MVWVSSGLPGLLPRASSGFLGLPRVSSGVVLSMFQNMLTAKANSQNMISATLKPTTAQNMQNNSSLKPP